MTEETAQIHLPQIKSEFKVISLDLIDDPAKPIRSDYSAESVHDLVISMRQVGIIEPLVVKPINGRYEVIAGHRRLVAAGIASIPQLPCYIVEADPQLTEILKMHENLFRQEISPIDESKFYDWLIQHHKLTPAKVAGMISKSQSYVMDRLQILQYPPELSEALAKKQIKFSVAREFFRVNDIDTMRKFLFYAIRSGITPGGAKQWVDDWKRGQNSQTVMPTTTAVDQQSGEEYIVYVTCIYCREQMKMFDATPAYIHPHCYSEVAETKPAV